MFLRFARSVFFETVGICQAKFDSLYVLYRRA